MRRFQAALNKQLSAQHEKVKLEYGELSEALKRKLNERETLGVELYGVQQELARYTFIGYFPPETGLLWLCDYIAFI